MTAPPPQTGAPTAWTARGVTTAWTQGGAADAWSDRWYHYDLTGNVTGELDASGLVQSHVRMEAFGTVLCIEYSDRCWLHRFCRLSGWEPSAPSSPAGKPASGSRPRPTTRTRGSITWDL